jgi:hypothetical protein
VFFIAQKSPGNLAEANQTKFSKMKNFTKNEKYSKKHFVCIKTMKSLHTAQF